MKATRAFGCVFTVFCGVLMLGALLELAGLLVGILIVAIGVIILGRVAIGVRYALRYGRGRGREVE